MKFTLTWLKQFLETEASLDQIVNKLTMIGLEVEEVIDRNTELNDFEAAEIIDAKPHPDADKLRICTVKSSLGLLSIVCGASNARSGIKVVLAKVGTLIPNGNFKIKQSKIRGVESNGMLCSAEELNIKGDSQGIIELPLELNIGDKVTPYFGLDDPVIHINITPNRADALGVYGIARDLAAAGLGKLRNYRSSKFKAHPCKFDSTPSTISPCPLFATIKIQNINNTETPKWLKNLLENIGVGSISPVVDVTNYICYSFGQPMHAYDADKISGPLKAEILIADSKFKSLNDKEYILKADDLVISDDKQIHCLAGIIGGKDSCCNESTTSIILEAASFDSKFIARTGRRLMIDSDSRYRFERNVDRKFTLEALDYAKDIIISICGGKQVEARIMGNDESPAKLIDFPLDFLALKSGLTLSIEKIVEILSGLGFEVKIKDKHLQINIPSWRYDVSMKEDIVEEIVRIYGYEQIPMTALPNKVSGKILKPEQRRNIDLKRLLASNGYTEIVSWSFMDSKIAQNFTDLKEELTLKNPISSDLNYMRSTIIPNLLKIARNNINRSYKDLSLFELGPIFYNAEDIIPVTSLTGIRIGMNAPKNSHSKAENFNFYDVKADVENVLASVGLDFNKCQLKTDTPSYYHPGRSASIMLGKNILGFFGEIHPTISKIFDIEYSIIAFEINLSSLPFPKEKFGRKTEYKTSDYQMVNRDYAFILDDSQNIIDVLNNIKNTNKTLIKDVNLFDVYIGDKIGSGKKSVAITVTIQDDKTLTEEDIGTVNKLILASIDKFGGVLRV